MFVRVKKINGYEYLYLVENAREGGRHVQRVVKSLGRRDEVEASGTLDALIASAARHSRRSIVLSSFYRGELAELRRTGIGPDLVFGRLWQETGCRDVLRGLLADRHFGFDVERAVYLTVLHRLMISGSDRHASTWRRSYRVPGAEELELDHAYKAMAWLGEDLGGPGGDGRVMSEAIEEALYHHRQPLLGELSVAFLDTTTLWFEGRGGATLGRRGHSKDYRGHLAQVVLGIVLDGDDRPVASFLLPGNTADVTLLLPVVARLRSRFGVRRACVVADRGLISADAIAALEAAGMEYILGVRERGSREVREFVLEDDGVPVPLSIPRQKGTTQLAVSEVAVEGRFAPLRGGLRPSLTADPRLAPQKAGRDEGMVSPVEQRDRCRPVVRPQLDSRYPLGFQKRPLCHPREPPPGGSIPPGSRCADCACPSDGPWGCRTDPA